MSVSRGTSAGRPAKCVACGEDVRLVRVRLGGEIPLDLDSGPPPEGPVPVGTYWISSDGEARPYVKASPTDAVYRSHYLSCAARGSNDAGRGPRERTTAERADRLAERTAELEEELRGGRDG